MKNTETTDRTRIDADKDQHEAKEYSVSSSGGPSLGERFNYLKQASSFERPKLTRPNWLNWLSRSVIVAAIVGLLAGLGGSALGNNLHDSGSVLPSNLSEQKKIVSSESQLISSIADEVGPSVVSVNVTGVSDVSSQDSFFGFSQPQQQVRSAGTGMIITSDGIILTNRHVVPDGTQNVSVTLSDGTELTDVEVLGRTNESDSLDVAFLKIKDTKGKKLTPVTIGDSSKVEVGDTVVAIGNALGQFQNTVTSGIISGYGRQVVASDASGSSSENLDDLFQTDAAINEGNSGGPLVNMNGQVIGLNTAIAGDAQNIGFAIPMNNMTGLIKQVIETGKLQRPYLGVRYVLLTDDYAYQFNLETKRGAYIPPAGDTTGPSIVPGSPADKAGLKEKDIITKVNGTPVDKSHSLVSLLGQHQVGDKVTLTIVRGDKTITVGVKLGAAPSS
jgi:S1-C subfamily serine protease